MNKNIVMVGVAAVVGLATLALLPAQEQFHPVPQVQVKEGQVTGGLRYGGIVQTVSGNTVTGAPYSADAVTETTQTLGDGNRIERRSSVKLYRDSQGRERQEEGGPEARRIFISDPVAKASFTLNPETHTAQKSPTLRIRQVNGPDQAQQLALALADLTAAQAAGGRGPLNGSINPIINIDVTGRISVKAPGSPDPEQLSPKTIEGVFATGTRRTVTIPAGQIGNLLPIQVVDETWYSPDLQVNIMTKHSDPRTGEVVYQLKNISRGEADATLFQVPPDYKITETGAGGRGGRSGNVTP